MSEVKYPELRVSATSREQAITRLDNIIKLLRKECPWDKVQDAKSLRPCMIEEAYEVVDAINNEDDVNLREELGDVMLQVIFHASLTEEAGKYDLVDIINDECEKMIRRHPHIFSDEDANTVDKVLGKWENIKKREHQNTTTTERLMDVPHALPALTMSRKVQKRAADVGFDWDSADGPFEKIAEETQELREAYKAKSKDQVIEEFGDLLFSMVNLSRFIDVDPEEALRVSTKKFIDRFAVVEKNVILDGKEMGELTLDELDEYWERAKELCQVII